MSAPIALLVAAGGMIVLAVLVVFAVAMYAAPRQITSGPLVAMARGLFVSVLLLVLVVFAATVWGVLSGWR